MAFSISHIVNKILNINAADSDLRENPFFTAEGQEIVSVSENFWARKLRHGRTAFKVWDTTPITANQFTNYTYNPSVDKIFIPDVMTFACDQDCSIRVGYIPIEKYDLFNPGYANEFIAVSFLKAGTPFVLKFDGNLEIHNPGGLIQFQVKSLTGGTVYACIHGIEVSKRA